MPTKPKSSSTTPMVTSPVKKYRYVCEACSNTGFISEVNDPARISPGLCQSCHKPLGKIKVENFIELQ